MKKVKNALIGVFLLAADYCWPAVKAFECISAKYAFHS
jgi:hypothetical protein